MGVSSGLETLGGTPTDHTLTPLCISTAPPMMLPPPLSDAACDVYRMQCSLAMALSHPDHAASLQTLAKVLSNICARPFDTKYRQLRLTSPRIQV